MKTLCIWFLICSVVTEYGSAAELSKSSELDKKNSIEANNEQFIESNNEKEKRRLYLLKAERIDVLAFQDAPTMSPSYKCGVAGDFCNATMICCKEYDCVTAGTVPVCTAPNRKLLRVSKTRHRQFNGKKKMKVQRYSYSNFIARLFKFQDPPTTNCSGPGDYCNTSMPCCELCYCVTYKGRPDSVCRSAHVSKIQQRQLGGKKKLNSQRYSSLNARFLAFQDPPPTEPPTDCGVAGDYCNSTLICCGGYDCVVAGTATACTAISR